MAVWPFPIPMTAYAGLNNASGEVAFPEYARVPFTLEYAVDGVRLSNLATLEWPTATSHGGWGSINSVPVYDAAEGGNLLFTAALGTPSGYGMGYFGVGFYGFTDAEFVIAQYDRVRMQAGELAASLNPTSLPRGYGTGRFGRYAYGTTPNISATTVLERTFQVFDNCATGTWSQGPIARAA